MLCSTTRVLQNHHKSNRRAAPCSFGPGTLLRQAGAGWRTLGTRTVLTGIWRWNLLSSTLLFLSTVSLAAQTTAQATLSSALRGTSAAGMVMDVNNGRQLAAVRATEGRHAPGSILKPLFLAAALDQREMLPETTVFCRRNLRISYQGQEWNLACTHPQGDVAFGVCAV